VTDRFGAERVLLKVLIADRARAPLAAADVDEALLGDPRHREIFRALTGGEAGTPELSPPAREVWDRLVHDLAEVQDNAQRMYSEVVGCSTSRSSTSRRAISRPNSRLAMRPERRPLFSANTRSC
jgi:hypothetical protein